MLVLEIRPRHEERLIVRHKGEVLQIVIVAPKHRGAAYKIGIGAPLSFNVQRVKGQEEG